jgi:L-fuconolactonase
MRIDAHHHFWDPAKYDYPWMVGDVLDPIRRAYGPNDMRPALELAHIDGTILVQTISSEDETRDFLHVAEATTFVKGVVGWVDLTSLDVGERLDRLSAAGGGGSLVGIRHQVHDEPDPRWLCRDDVQNGLRAVEARGLTYDLLLRARELPSAVETVKANPDLRFVVDHIAKPKIAHGSDPDWERTMRQLSAFPNVSVKVSGMVTEADWAQWSVTDLRPFVEQVLDWFEPRRLMFGSDWPVCLLAADSYGTVLQAASDALGELSEAETALVFGGNAQSFYGVSDLREGMAR